MPNAVGRSAADTRNVDAAIARVLDAERGAREAVAQHVHEAESVAEQARERAREIARRAAQRAVRVQRWSAEQLQSRLEDLKAEQGRDEGGETDAVVAQRLNDVVGRLADELTGALK